MNRLLPCLFAAALAVPAARSAAEFEGKVSFKMINRGQPQEMNYSIKGDKMRLEMPAQAASGMGGVIIDTTKKEMTVIMDMQKMYMVNAMPDVAAPPPGEKTGEAPTLEKSGEKEKILGYTAEKYISTYQGQKTEMWLAEGLGTFMGPGGGPMGGRRGGGARGGGGSQAWERALAGKELFPLRVVGKDKDGAETFRMDVTSIEKQSLPDSLFAPPAGYQKFDMGGMMKGMMPGR